ncbi:MAG TPA: ABC transporter substrate-binding protein, partial [Bacillota bacterium]|nr:ABC transporter substrate-binding protein [Bacillota bacterium]
LTSSATPEHTTTPGSGETTPLSDPTRVHFKLAGLKGPTSMGLAPLVVDAKKGTEAFDLTFELVASPEEIVPMIIRGDVDLAAVPANLASVLYNKTEGKIAVVAINTLGILNIVERGNTVQSLKDLAGKTVYASGKGSVPEYAIRLLLEKNGIDPDKDVKLEWLSDHSAVVAQAAKEEGSVALMPQPFVTVAQQQLKDLRLAIDLNTEWERAIADAGLIMGVLVARKEVVEKDPEMLEAFLNQYETSINFVNEKPEEASALIEELDIFKGAIAKKAIPFCNIRYISGAEMYKQLSGFLKLMMEANPQSVGGKLPGDEFYFGGK